MIEILDKRNCCGCSACTSVCPQKCIEMKVDNEGFLYPEVEKTTCVNCGLCENVCPVLNAKKNNIINVIKKAFLIQNRNIKVLKESTSGGFFSVLAEHVIEQGGIVIGAAYDSEFNVKHIIINNIEGLEWLRNSKYTQSNINGMYLECKEILETGKKVCFSGTPCQIAGLIDFLGKKYENLITVDVVCRGVPSPLLFAKYIKWLGGSDKISSIKFRDKHYGYFCSMMSVYYKSGKVIRKEIHSDPMLRFFFNNMCSRPSCHKCAIKTLDRLSDFTMFDCWHANKFSNKFGTYGTTAVIVRNNDAYKLLKDLKEEFLYEEVDLETVIELDGSMMLKSVPASEERDDFFYALNCDEFDAVIRRFGRGTIVEEIKVAIKKALIYMGIFEKYMGMKMKK